MSRFTWAFPQREISNHFDAAFILSGKLRPSHITLLGLTQSVMAFASLLVALSDLGRLCVDAVGPPAATKREGSS